MLRRFFTSDIVFFERQDGAHQSRLKEAVTVLLEFNAGVTRAYGSAGTAAPSTATQPATSRAADLTTGTRRAASGAAAFAAP